MNKEVIIYTDGGSRGNPGIAGAGAYITSKDGTHIKSVSKSLGETTNNEAEYRAVILGLASIKNKLGKDSVKELPIEVRMDSELVCKQLNGQYQVKEERLYQYFIQIHNMRVSEMKNVSFTHIPREQNKEADKLANDAMDKQETLL
jgi:ribonuclease HI